MKRILLFCVLVVAFSSIFAQENKIQEDMVFYNQFLKLNSNQQAELSRIIIRKHNDLQEISSFRETDEAHYRIKRRGIYKGTEGSIYMLLEPSQKADWQEYRTKMRIANAELVSALKAQNASRQDILDAQQGIVQ